MYWASLIQLQNLFYILHKFSYDSGDVKTQSTNFIKQYYTHAMKMAIIMEYGSLEGVLYKLRLLFLSEGKAQVWYESQLMLVVRATPRVF